MNMIECNIGDSLASKLSRLNLSILISLNLYADPITNRGIKQLMKLNLPFLKAFTLIETCITMDSFEVLRKGSFQLAKISINYHRCISFNKILRGLYRLLTDKVIPEYSLRFH